MHTIAIVQYIAHSVFVIVSFGYTMPSGLKIIITNVNALSEHVNNNMCSLERSRERFAF